MKIEYRKVNNGLLQITTTDERYYSLDNGQTFFPSNSWVASYWPKGAAFERWLTEKGDEAEQIKKDAGNKGSKVHQAIEDLLRGVEIVCDAKYMNHETGREEELTVDEYYALITFAAWWKELNAKHTVKILKTEQSAIADVFGQKVGYTLDLLLEVNGQVWLVDYKTSKNVYMSHKLQLWLMQASEKADKALILQVGYERNKNGYKVTELEEDYRDDYAACLKIWSRETSEKQPLQREFPLSIKLVD